MSNKVLILTKNAARYAELLTAAALPDLTMIPAIDLAAAAPVVADCQIILGAPGLIQSVLPLAEQLQWVQSTWAGVEVLLRPELRHDYLLTNVRGIFGPLMAEYVFSYLLLHERGVLARYQAQQRQHWDTTLPGTMRGKTIGILGVGSIGAFIAQTAKQFGLRTFGYTRSSRDCEAIDQYFHGDELLQLAAEVDYLVCTLPTTAESHHLINAAVLDVMKPSAVLINVGRGSAVDEEALLAALQQHKLALAVLDVVEQEPLPAGHPLWRAPNLLLTGHTAAPSFPEDIAPIFIENYYRFVAQRPLLYTVDFARGY